MSSKTHLAPYNFKPLFVQFHPPNKRKLPYFLLRRHNSHCEVRGGHFLSATTAPTNRPGHCCTTNNLQVQHQVRNTPTCTARSWSWFTSKLSKPKMNNKKKVDQKGSRHTYSNVVNCAGSAQPSQCLLSFDWNLTKKFEYFCKIFLLRISYIQPIWMSHLTHINSVAQPLLFLSILLLWIFFLQILQTKFQSTFFFAKILSLTISCRLSLQLQGD